MKHEEKNLVFKETMVPRVWVSSKLIITFPPYRDNEALRQILLIPNYLWALFQSECWCLSFLMKMSFHLHVNEN